MKKKHLTMKLIRIPLLFACLCIAAVGCQTGTGSEKTSSQGTTTSGSSASTALSDPSKTGSEVSDTSAQASSSAGSSGSKVTSNNTTGNKTNSVGNTTTKKPTTTADVFGTSYRYSQDSFYKKTTIYATWVNVWNGSTENWFKGLAYSDYGPRIRIDGDWVVPDANKSDHRKYVFAQAKNAGINALMMDLTNGYSGWSGISKDYQKMCFENNMKFGVAVHPKTAAEAETICEFIWKTYAAPGVASYSSAYLYKNGKPLIVLYSTKGEYNASVSSNGTYTKKFEFAWASGEDSEANKWGWQLEAQDGPVASKDSMFITPAISWNSPASSVDAWRSSLAYLDFGFQAVRQNNPHFIIVGSVDDTTEHNGWMTMDTSKKTYVMPTITSSGLEIGLSYQMKDINGNISTDAFYNRVKQWITTGKASVYHKGGLLADGAYTLTNKASNQMFGVTRPAPRTKPATDLNAVFRRGYQVSTQMESYYWFYHLGNNEYKIIKLSSGLALQPDSSGRLIQTWNENTAKQRWIVSKQANGSYLIVNKSTGAALHDMANSDDTIYTKAKNSTSNQQWAIKGVSGHTIAS